MSILHNRAALTVVVLAASVVVWETACRYYQPPAFVLPAPSQIAAEFATTPVYFLREALVTLAETVAGFVLAIAFGLALALAINSSRFLEATLYTLLVALNSVPKVALAPVFIIWMGTGVAPKVTIALAIAIFPVVIDFVLGLRSSDPQLVDLAHTARSSWLKILLKVRLPSALPSMFAGMKVAISLALVGAIVGEFVAGETGLGQVILLAQGQFQTARMFVAIVILGLLGAALFYLLDFSERMLIPWHISQRAPRSGRP
ncbi:NitT/TauT family transport system permease protein [Nitrobacteraceae bacterium AZCC 2146]